MQAMRISSAFCVAGWLAIYFAEVSASGLVLGSELALEASPILAVTGILVYIGSFSIGMGAVPWVVMSECPTLITISCPGALMIYRLIMWLSGTFILYGAINALAIVFIVKVVPETKGRTLEEIQAAINA
ncbi:hypothetical protein C3L33_04076, partial [Rhododendron williamsianum]